MYVRTYIYNDHKMQSEQSLFSCYVKAHIYIINIYIVDFDRGPLLACATMWCVSLFRTPSSINPYTFYS